MTTYTYTEARQHLAALLDQAKREGAVRIRRRDGATYLLRFEPELGSPLDVKGVQTDLSAEEIVQIVREGRER